MSTKVGENHSDYRRGRQYCDGLLPFVETHGREVRQKVMARRPRAYFKASEWELDDAEEEGIEQSYINHAPKRFVVVENGKLTGMEFERLEWDAKAKESRVIDTVTLPADDVILAIGQENDSRGSSVI